MFKSLKDYYKFWVCSGKNVQKLNKKSLKYKAYLDYKKYISKIEAIKIFVDFRISYEIMNIRTNTGYSRSNSNSRYDLKEKFP